FGAHYAPPSSPLARSSARARPARPAHRGTTQDSSLRLTVSHQNLPLQFFPRLARSPTFPPRDRIFSVHVWHYLPRNPATTGGGCLAGCGSRVGGPGGLGRSDGL